MWPPGAHSGVCAHGALCKSTCRLRAGSQVLPLPGLFTGRFWNCRGILAPAGDLAHVSSATPPGQPLRPD